MFIVLILIVNSSITVQSIPFEQILIIHIGFNLLMSGILQKSGVWFIGTCYCEVSENDLKRRAVMN
jgi:hypothetical protein